MDTPTKTKLIGHLDTAYNAIGQKNTTARTNVAEAKKIVVAEPVIDAPPPPPPPPASLRIPVEHVSVLNYDDLEREDLTRPGSENPVGWSYSSPQCYIARGGALNSGYNSRTFPNDEYHQKLSEKWPSAHGKQGAVIRLRTQPGQQSLYDAKAFSGQPNDSTRTQFNKGHRYTEGELSVTYLDVRFPGPQEALHNSILNRGLGGITYFTQILQLKRWGREPFVGASAGYDGFTTGMALDNDDTDVPYPIGRIVRIGWEGRWVRPGASGGYIRLWSNRRDATKMEPETAKLPATLGGEADGGTYFCFGLYHRLWTDPSTGETEAYEGQIGRLPVTYDFANPTVYKLARPST